MTPQGASRGLTLLLSIAVALLGCPQATRAAPQAQAQTQPQPNIEALVEDIFSMNPSQQQQQQQQQPSAPVRPATRRVGFDTIVTPEPVDPSQPQPQVAATPRRQCNCVPYHMCDPSTNSVIKDDEGDFDGFGLIDIRFNADDPVCDHFLDVCCADGNTHRESLTPTPVESRPNRPTGCGIRNVGGIDFNITGASDNESGFGEFPWTVAILHAGNYSYFCAGSLIHPRVVLTAVHCVINRPLGSFLVRAGEWDSQTNKERLAYQERGVQRVLTHPQYNARNVAFDFALVVLEELVVLGDHINVVCLPAQSAQPAARTPCLATGWGKDVFGAAGRYSAIMKRVPLPIVDFGECQTRLKATRLGPRFVLDRSFICAGGEDGVDTCQGDGGAPLVCPIGPPSENRYEQSGIVAWGIGCNQQIPAAYANVALARDWIDEQMLANGFGTTSYSAF